MLLKIVNFGDKIFHDLLSLNLLLLFKNIISYKKKIIHFHKGDRQYLDNFPINRLSVVIYFFLVTFRDIIYNNLFEHSINNRLRHSTIFQNHSQYIDNQKTDHFCCDHVIPPIFSIKLNIEPISVIKNENTLFLFPISTIQALKVLMAIIDKNRLLESSFLILPCGNLLPKITSRQSLGSPYY